MFEREPASGMILSQEISDKLLLYPHSSALSSEMERGLTSTQVDCCLKALDGEVPASTLNQYAMDRWKEKFAGRA